MITKSCFTFHNIPQKRFLVYRKTNICSFSAVGAVKKLLQDTRLCQPQSSKAPLEIYHLFPASGELH